MIRRLATTLTAALLLAGCATAEEAPDPLGMPERPTPAAHPPGLIGEAEDAGVTPEGAAVRLFRYASRDARGGPMEVGGAAFIPAEPAEGPRPLLVLAPGTWGMADRCAPSASVAGGNIPDQARHFTALGWTVVQTDYQGLGTPGLHTYMVRAAQAHAVLDIVAAAVQLDPALGDRPPTAIAGYSQGGGAAAAAAELQPEYAPDLDLRAVDASAVPADLVEVTRGVDESPLAGVVGYAINGMVAAYPELAEPVGAAVNDEGRAFLAEVRDQCLNDTGAAFGFRSSTELTADGRTMAEHLTDPEFGRLLAEQRIGDRVPAAPVIMAHNVTDAVVPFGQARDLARTWCAAGAAVRFLTVDESVGPMESHGVADARTRAERNEFLYHAVVGDAPIAPPNCGEF